MGKDVPRFQVFVVLGHGVRGRGIRKSVVTDSWGRGLKAY